MSALRSLALSPRLWSGSGGWDLPHHLPPVLSPTQHPLSILMPEGNLGLPQAGAQLPRESGGAETGVPGAWPAAIMPVVGTRGRYMWGHLCFSKPAEARASAQYPSLLKSRRRCRLERNLSNPLPPRSQLAGQGWVRARPVPPRGRGLPLLLLGCARFAAAACARGGAACTCARTRG